MPETVADRLFSAAASIQGLRSPGVRKLSNYLRLLFPKIVCNRLVLQKACRTRVLLSSSKGKINVALITTYKRNNYCQN